MQICAQLTIFSNLTLHYLMVLFDLFNFETPINNKSREKIAINPAIGAF